MDKGMSRTEVDVSGADPGGWIGWLAPPPPPRKVHLKKKLIHGKTNGNTLVQKIEIHACMQMQNHREKCSLSEICGAAPWTNDGVFTFGRLG